MAKGNLFLGMGRGKVGDVVFYRMNGWQMARVRNRNPKNPRSNEQLYQRAVIATTMKAYSIGKEIFDHSFQGYTIGEGCMRRFNSINARILREQMITDINGFVAPSEAIGRFVAPHSSSATPIIGIQVSEGTLTNNLYIPTIKPDGTYNFKTASMPGVNNVNEYLKALNISAGDIFTFVFLLADKTKPIYQTPWWKESPFATQYTTKFCWLRLIVKSEISDELSMPTALMTDVFDIETGGNTNVSINSDFTFGKQDTLMFQFELTDFAGVAACIRSRDDMDLRSTEFTVPFNSKEFGIATGFVLDAWQNMVQKVGQSELILEGGDNVATYIDETNTPVIDSPEQEEILPKRGRTKA